MSHHRDFGNEISLLGGLPKVGRIAGVPHVWEADCVGKPIAGPFASSDAARWWIVEHLEKTLTAVQRAVWVRVMEHNHATRDAGLELGLIDMVKHNRTFEQIEKYLPRERAMPARRILAPVEGQS
jgi:hypothetical protein